MRRDPCVQAFGSSMMLTWAATILQPSGKADPGLHLPADLAAQPSVAIEQGGGHGGVAAIGGDDGLAGASASGRPASGRRETPGSPHSRRGSRRCHSAACARRCGTSSSSTATSLDTSACLVARELRRSLRRSTSGRSISIGPATPLGDGAAATPICSSACATRSADVLPPRRGDDLHADRQRLERHRHGHHRQADERDRLGVDADIGAHRQFDAVEHEIHLAQLRRGAGRRRRDDHVDVLEQPPAPARDTSGGISARGRPAAPAPWRPRSAGRAPPDRSRSARVRRRSRCSEAPSVVGDDVGRRTGAARPRAARSIVVAPSALATRATASSASETRSAGSSRRRRRCGRSADAPRAARVAGSIGAGRARGIVGIRPLHGVVGQREVARPMRANGPR